VIDEDEKIREKTLEIFDHGEKEIEARFEMRKAGPEYLVFVLLPMGLLFFVILWRNIDHYQNK